MSDTPIPGQPEPDHIRQLREQAEAGRRAQGEVGNRDRTIAFLRAGVDPESDLGAAIVRRLGDGEVTAETVTAARDQVETALGLKQPPAQPTPPAAPAANTPEGQFAAIQAGLATGGTPATILPPPAMSGEDRAMDEYEKARKRGLPEDEAREIGIAAMIISAQEGDPTTTFNEGAWFQERAMHGHGAEFVGLSDAKLTANPLGPNSVQAAKAAAGRR